MPSIESIQLREIISDRHDVAANSAENVINSVYNPSVEKMLKNIDEFPHGILPQLTEFKKEIAMLPKARGLPLSPVTLSVRHIYEQFIGPFEQALESSLTAMERSYTAFVINFDIAFGACLVRDGLLLGENLRYNSITLLQRSRERIQKEGFDMPISVRIQLLKSASEYERSLREDPTGKTLVDELIKWVKGEPSQMQHRPGAIRPLNVRELVIFGAESFGRLYKAIYPLAEQTMRQ